MSAEGREFINPKLATYDDWYKRSCQDIPQSLLIIAPASLSQPHALEIGCEFIGVGSVEGGEYFGGMYWYFNVRQDNQDGVTIKSAVSGQDFCLDMDVDTYIVSMQPYKPDSDSQVWVVTPQGDGNIIKNKQTNKYLGLSEGNIVVGVEADSAEQWNISFTGISSKGDLTEPKWQDLVCGISVLPIDTTFYTQRVETKYGIPIVASGQVNPKALQAAKARVEGVIDNLKLDHDDALAWVRDGGRVIIWGRNESLYDFPESQGIPQEVLRRNAEKRKAFTSLYGNFLLTYEENLLCDHIYRDSRSGSDVCIHEFAHLLLHSLESSLHGKSLRKELDVLLEKHRTCNEGSGLTSGCAGYFVTDTSSPDSSYGYSYTNYHEYFANSVEAWFSTANYNDYAPGSISVNTRQQLKKYDPGMYQFLSKIFYDRPLQIPEHVACFYNNFDPKYYYRLLTDFSGGTALWGSSQKTQMQAVGDSNNQLWSLFYMGNGVYKVMSAMVGVNMALDALTDSRKVSLRSMSSEAGQFWYFESIPGTERYRLVNYADDQFLESGPPDGGERFPKLVPRSDQYYTGQMWEIRKTAQRAIKADEPRKAISDVVDKITSAIEKTAEKERKAGSSVSF